MSDRYTLDADRNAVPCESITKWAEFFENTDFRRVARTEIGPVTVSTVFLGLDRQWG